MPVMLLFFVGFQLAELSSAALVVRRASAAAGRAAAVVLPDDPAYYDGQEAHRFEGRRRDDIYLSAAMVLSASPQLDGDYSVEVSEPSLTEFAAIDVTVSATFHCGGVSILCGVDREVPLYATTRHAYHRAEYEYDLLGDLSGDDVEVASTTQSVRQRPGGTGGSNGGSGTGGTGGTGGGSSTPQTAKQRLLAEINSKCGCTKNAPKDDTARCIAFAAASEAGKALRDVHILNSRPPEITPGARAALVRFIDDKVHNVQTKGRLMNLMLIVPATDFVAILVMIDEAVTVGDADVRARSAGMAKSGETVYRLDTRAPTPAGWNGTSYMAPNPAHPAEGEPFEHYKRDSNGTATYVSVSGVGAGTSPSEGIRQANAALGGLGDFKQPPFLCLKEKKNGGQPEFVTVACSQAEFEVSEYYQYEAPDHAIYAPSTHPVATEYEVLCLAVKPAAYRKVLYVHYLEPAFGPGVKAFEHKSTKKLKITY